MAALRFEDLPSATQKKLLDEGYELSPIEPATKSPQKLKAKKDVAEDTKREVIAKVRSRPIHAIVLLILATVLAYGFLAIGWLVGAIGDSIWALGQALHRDKWRIT